jgi:hypothetical protein
VDYIHAALALGFGGRRDGLRQIAEPAAGRGGEPAVVVAHGRGVQTAGLGFKDRGRDSVDDADTLIGQTDLKAREQIALSLCKGTVKEYDDAHGWC